MHRELRRRLEMLHRRGDRQPFPRPGRIWRRRSSQSVRRADRDRASAGERIASRAMTEQEPTAARTDWSLARCGEKTVAGDPRTIASGSADFRAGTS